MQLRILFGLFILLNPFLSQAESLMQETPQSAQPILMIGTMTFNPPFETTDTVRHTLSGFEIDIMNAVCQRMKVECKYKSVPNVIDVFNLLAQKKIDLAVASIIILKGDGNHVFSTPYLPSGIQFFAKKDTKLKTVTDAMNSRIGTTDDPLIQSIITINYAKEYPVKVYDTPQAGIDALTDDKIDVFVMQTAIAKYWLSITGDAFKLVGNAVPIGLGNGVIAMNDAVELMAHVNEALIAMQQDGTYAQIYNRYNML